MSSGHQSATGDVQVAGLDGCRGGWVLATVQAGAQASGHDGQVDVDCTPPVDIRVIDSLETVADALASRRLVAAGIDIPIGLPPARHGPRACDIAARRMLGPRRSTIFPAPARAVLEAEGYDQACALARAATGKAISKQTFHILPKIREVDRLLAPATTLQEHLFEMCPELSFAVLVGGPMRHAKRTAEGRAERQAALARVFGRVADLVARPPTGAASDDVLDALVGAWTAGRYVSGTHLQLGGEVDEIGLRMEIIA
jgi:predicted RNase H-like nuclease